MQNTLKDREHSYEYGLPEYLQHDLDVLLFPAFGVVAGAEYDNRPEALLAAMGTAPAEVVV